MVVDLDSTASAPVKSPSTDQLLSLVLSCPGRHGEDASARYCCEMAQLQILRACTFCHTFRPECPNLPSLALHHCDLDGVLCSLKPCSRIVKSLMDLFSLIQSSLEGR